MKNLLFNASLARVDGRAHPHTNLFRHLAATINKEKQSQTEHGHFVTPNRADLLCRRESNNNSENGGQQTTSASKDENALAVTSHSFCLGECEFQKRREYINKWHELQKE